MPVHSIKPNTAPTKVKTLTPRQERLAALKTRRLAVHEAAHWVFAVVFGDGSKAIELSIVPEEQSAGRLRRHATLATSIGGGLMLGEIELIDCDPECAESFMRNLRPMLEGELLTVVAGRAAERALCGSTQWLDGTDFLAAFALARALLTSHEANKDSAMVLAYLAEAEGLCQTELKGATMTVAERLTGSRVLGRDELSALRADLRLDVCCVRRLGAYTPYCPARE
jgi:hypothetical protein